MDEPYTSVLRLVRRLIAHAYGPDAAVAGQRLHHAFRRQPVTGDGVHRIEMPVRSLGDDVAMKPRYRSIVCVAPRRFKAVTTKYASRSQQNR